MMIPHLPNALASEFASEVAELNDSFSSLESERIRIDGRARSLANGATAIAFKDLTKAADKAAAERFEVLQGLHTEAANALELIQRLKKANAAAIADALDDLTQAKHEASESLKEQGWTEEHREPFAVEGYILERRLKGKEASVAFQREVIARVPAVKAAQAELDGLRRFKQRLRVASEDIEKLRADSLAKLERLAAAILNRLEVNQ